MKPTLMFHGNQQGTPVRQTAPQHHLPAPTGTMPFGSGAPRQVPGAPASVGYGAAGQGHNGAEQPSATVNFAGPTSGGPPGSNHVAAFAGQMPGGIESHAGHRSPNGHAPSQGFGQQQAPSQGFGHTAGSSQSFGQQLGSHPSFGGPQAVPSGPSAYHPPAGHYPGSTSPPVAPSLPPEPLLMGGEFTQSSGAVEDIRRGFKLLVGNLGIASAPALAVGVLAYLLTAFAGSLGGVLALPFNLLLPLAIAAGWHVLLQSYLNRTVDFKLALRSVFKLGIGRIASIYVLMLIAGLTLWIPFGFFLPVILFGERNKLFENAARNWGLVSRDIVRPIAICVLCAFALAIASLPLMVLGAFVPAIAALTYAVISIFAGLLVSATAIPLYFQVRQLAEGGDIRLAVREHLRAPARVAAPTRPPSAGFDGGVALPQGGGQPFHQPLYGQQGGYPHQPGGGVPHGANNTAYPQHGAGFGGAPHHYGAAPGPQPSFPPTGGYPPS
jgi:hypothetical protein